MINVNTLKAGLTFEEDGNIFLTLDSQHSKQGRGQATVKVKVKNLRTGAIVVKTFSGGSKVNKAHIVKKVMDYLYSDGTNIILMDQSTFEQMEVPIEKVRWELNFLADGSKVDVQMFEQEFLTISLPLNVTLRVKSAPDAVKGNTATHAQKKVTLETGYELDAPMFIKENEMITVSTESGKYVGRGEK